MGAMINDFAVTRWSPRWFANLQA